MLSRLMPMLAVCCDQPWCYAFRCCLYGCEVEIHHPKRQEQWNRVILALPGRHQATTSTFTQLVGAIDLDHMIFAK